MSHYLQTINFKTSRSLCFESSRNLWPSCWRVD